MRYADPSANRDLLGNRTLLFIFICAFALVTLLQQILYGRNYIKRGLQFGWQSGDQLANWTGLFNVTDNPAVQSSSDSSSRSHRRNQSKRPVWKTPNRTTKKIQTVLKKALVRSSHWIHAGEVQEELESVYFEFYEGPFEYNSTRCLELRHEILEVKVLSMVKQSELFDRWKSLQMCKWAMNISEANQFKSTLSRCCNAPAFLFTTQKNTPLGTKLKYEVDTSGIYHINQEIFRMFPKDMPYYRSQFKKCAVVGNGGILKNSRCGREINSADFVFRCNLPPISEKYTVDVGVKTDVVTVNPSIITERFHKLEKWRRPFYRVLQVYENASVLLPAFYNTRNTDVSIRVKYVLDDFESPQAVYYFHPQYLVNVSRYWLSLGVRAKRISTGLILATAALELCEEVHLFGFWAFPMNPSGLYITHHYYDNVKPRPGFHAMPSEIFNFLHLHSRGILRVHTGTCGCC
ncbi:alpha-2,8-sialyltransferase 8E isoform X2 [Marmota marmota marmota]|uniref:alpha-2,8-sialyltransferase 8E isoform X2 n=1 Tax=Marmota marmota marmota TaxID=9994 RepID=UPI002091F240|nr:alpha-2,8-sialyltransferase 8E isoform X2 [Marmota marmota marmota]